MPPWVQHDRTHGRVGGTFQVGLRLPESLVVRQRRHLADIVLGSHTFQRGMPSAVPRSNRTPAPVAPAAGRSSRTVLPYMLELLGSWQLLAAAVLHTVAQPLLAPEGDLVFDLPSASLWTSLLLECPARMPTSSRQGRRPRLLQCARTIYCRNRSRQGKR